MSNRTPLAEVLALGSKCLQVAERAHGFFVPPRTRERKAAAAMFCRCMDQARASLILAEAGLPIESQTMTRGLCETLFVLGALLNGSTTVDELEVHDRGSNAKGAKAIDDFLRREGSPELRASVARFAVANVGPVVSAQDFARRADKLDLYDGFYRMLSNHAAHPSLSAVSQYFEANATLDRSRSSDASKVTAWMLAVLVQACAMVEKYVRTSPEVKRQIHELLDALDSINLA